MDKQEQPKLVEVTILTDNHVHAGIAIPKNGKIECTEPEADWLEKHEIGKRTSVAGPAAPGAPRPPTQPAS